MIRLVGVLLVFATLFVAVRQGDVLSCQRSNVVRRSQMGYEQYARDAADARYQAYLYYSSRGDTKLAAIDKTAARKFLADAARVRVVYISCGGAFPLSK